MIAAVLSLTFSVPAQAGTRKVVKPQPAKNYTVPQPQCKNGKCHLKK
jgi:hypothetical protein